jgi:hypothetical protein
MFECRFSLKMVRSQNLRTGITSYLSDEKEQSHKCVRLNVESIAPQPSEPGNDIERTLPRWT